MEQAKSKPAGGAQQTAAKKPATLTDVIRQRAQDVGETLEAQFGDSNPQAYDILFQALEQRKVHRDEVRRILLWNFKSGHASVKLLERFPLAEVVSSTNSKDFHVEFAKKRIDQRFPWRHVLRLGDNKEVAQQLREFDAGGFDLVVIDVREGKKGEIGDDIMRSLVHMKSGSHVVCLGAKINDRGTQMLSHLITAGTLDLKNAVQWGKDEESLFAIAV